MGNIFDALLLGAGALWVVHQLNPGVGSRAAVNFTVNEGDTLGSVSARLRSVGTSTTQALSASRRAYWRSGGMPGATPVMSSELGTMTLARSASAKSGVSSIDLATMVN